MAKRASNRAAKPDEQKSEDTTTVTESEVAKTDEAESTSDSATESEPSKTDQSTDDNEASEHGPETIRRIATISSLDFKYHETRQLAARILIAKVGTLNAKGYDASHHIQKAWAEAEAFVEYAESKAPETEE